MSCRPLRRLWQYPKCASTIYWTLFWSYQTLLQMNPAKTPKYIWITVQNSKYIKYLGFSTVIQMYLAGFICDSKKMNVNFSVLKLALPYYKSAIIDKRATLIVRPLLRSSSSYSPLFHRVFPYSHGLEENMQGLLFFSATPNAIACYYCWILCMYTLLSTM